MLEKTLESPLDCKEIQPVHSKGDQSWDFFGRNDAKAETPVLWSGKLPNTDDILGSAGLGPCESLHPGPRLTASVTHAPALLVQQKRRLPSPGEALHSPGGWGPRPVSGPRKSSAFCPTLLDSSTPLPIPTQGLQMHKWVSVALPMSTTEA